MTTARDRQDAFRSTRRQLDLERQARQIPGRFKYTHSDVNVLVILNGNAVGGGAKGVKYAASVSLGALPDISLDTDVADGLGRAQLYTNGVLVGRVWVRHDRVADAGPLVAGDRRGAAATVSISYGSGSITAYRWDW